MNQTLSARMIAITIVSIQILLSVFSCVYFPGIRFAIVPHESPLWTILTAPIVHADWKHLLSNLEVFIPLIVSLFLFYEKYAVIIYAILYVTSGILLWSMGSFGAHLGLSGVIIALAIYVVLSGFFSMEWRKVLVSIVICAIYFAVVTQFYVSEPGVSIDAHICGFISGFVVVVVQYFPKESFRFS